MKKHIPSVVLVALVCVGLSAGPAFSAAPGNTKKVTFSSKYSGKASLLINNGKATISSITGFGQELVVRCQQGQRQRIRRRFAAV